MGGFQVALLTVIWNRYFTKSERALEEVLINKVPKNPFCHNHCILYNSHIFERSYSSYGADAF